MFKTKKFNVTVTEQLFWIHDHKTVVNNVKYDTISYRSKGLISLFFISIFSKSYFYLYDEMKLLLRMSMYE